MEVDDLIKNIHDFFLGQYNGSLDGSNTFLAFEPLGLMVSPADFQYNGDFNPTLARQMVSMMVDNVPAINSVFEPDAINKISDQYAGLVGDGDKLTGTMMFYGESLSDTQTAQYLALFGQLKTAAQQKFAQTGAESSLLDPMASIAACNVTPGTWYDASSPVWQHKTFQSATSQSSGTSTTGGGTTVDPPPFAWKLGLNMQALQATRVNPAVMNHLRLISNVEPPITTVAAQPAPAAAPAGPAAAQMRKPMPLAMHQSAAVNSNVIHPMLMQNLTKKPVENAPSQVTPLLVNRLNYTALRKGIVFSQMINLNRVIGSDSAAVTAPIYSSQFNIDFSYSMVRIDRDWMYEPLINKAALWYSLTNKAGDYSTGENSAANTGLLRCIPKAMIVVKDLNISAQWSDTDRQSAASSYGFGCFNISSSAPITTTNNQLTSPGIQVIGWICEVMPKLPLNDDPGMSSTGNDASMATTTDPLPATENPNDQNTATETTPAGDASVLSTAGKDAPPLSSSN